MKKKLFIKLWCAVFAASFLIMACQPTKDDNRRQSMRNNQSRQMYQESKREMDGNQRMPMKKQYKNDDCCPKNDCCKPDCEWCKPRCEDTDQPQGIYAPMQPKKKQCPECPKDDCGSCGCCDDCCDDCSGDCCDSCGCDDCCDPCDSCGCDSCGCDDCCDPCDSCGCDSCGCDDCCDPCDDCCNSCDSCECSSCCPSGRKYTRDEIFGRDTNERNENRTDPRRYSEK
jgi:hypothetical protein